MEKEKIEIDTTDAVNMICGVSPLSVSYKDAAPSHLISSTGGFAEKYEWKKNELMKLPLSTLLNLYLNIKYLS